MIKMFEKEIKEEEIVVAKLDCNDNFFTDLTVYGEFDDEGILSIYRNFSISVIYRNGKLLKQLKKLDKEHPEIRKFFLDKITKLDGNTFSLLNLMKCFKFKKEDYEHLSDKKLSEFVKIEFIKISPSDLIKRFPNIVPKVGDKYSAVYGSDSRPYEVIEVNKTKVKLRALDYKPAEGFDYYSNQVYDYSSNPKGSIIETRIQSNGRLKITDTKIFLRVGAKAYSNPSF